ncbi:hypothetical protein Tco_0261325 [Tanacetum coccineum]
MACNQMAVLQPVFKEKGRYASVRFSLKERNLLVFTSVDMIVMTSMESWKVYSVHLFDELFQYGENQVVSKSSDVTTADVFDKRQQQQDSTSSTSSLASTISADGNFDLKIAKRGGRVWRGHGCQGVTRRCLEALELKGGDGGACKVLGWLLGDVMVMQGRCLRCLVA